jgi:hypothetical protein
MTETEIVVQDLRRELRWSYKDQSIDKLLALSGKLTNHKDTSSIICALKSYTSSLFIAKGCEGKYAFDKVKLCAYTLLDAIKKWEQAHA